MGLFFRIMGIVLMVFAAGLLVDAVQNMQELGWIPVLDQAMWNTSSYLSESSSIGDVFHSLVGYADRPTVLQAIVWIAYLGVAATAFVVKGRRGSPAPSAQSAPDTAAAAGSVPVAVPVDRPGAADLASDPAPSGSGAPLVTRPQA